MTSVSMWAFLAIWHCATRWLKHLFIYPVPESQTKKNRLVGRLLQHITGSIMHTEIEAGKSAPVVSVSGDELNLSRQVIRSRGGM